MNRQELVEKIAAAEELPKAKAAPPNAITGT